jgi:G3E family GTPase
MRSGPLPVVALTGFLGSGKTSLLQHWLTQATVEPQKMALVINDFGAVNIDAALLSQPMIEMREIAGGCVCCASFEELVEQLSALSARPEIELAWLETSGLAETEEMLDRLTSPELLDKITLRRLVQVIDAANFPASWRHRAAEVEQTQYADWLILNKIDLVDQTRQEELLRQLRELNPTAQIRTATRGKADSTGLLEDSRKRDSSGAAHEHPHEHDHNEAASSYFYPLRSAVARSDFEKFLNALPEGVYRAKGFVRFTDNPKQLYTFQQVSGQKELLLLPMEALTVPVGLVFIGPQLNVSAIRQKLDGWAGEVKTGGTRLPVILN